MGIALKNYDIAGSALAAFKTIDDSFRAEDKLDLERRAQNRADQESDENSQIRQLTIRKGLKAEADDAETQEIAAALQTGDLSKLSNDTALAVNKQLEAAGYNQETVLPRLKAASVLKPVIDSFAEQSKAWQQQAASGQGLLQTDTVHLAQDANFSALKPYLKDLFFDKTRFNDQSGGPKLHTYDVNGQQVLGMVDQSDPVADVVYHSPSGKMMVGLNVKAIKTDESGSPIKDSSGNFVVDDSIKIPQGIATTGRSNSHDDTIRTMTLPELQQKTTELIKSGEAVMGIRRKALEAEYLRRSPIAREGLSKALAGKFENRQAWTAAEESPELKALYDDPVMGSALKNIGTVTQAFGGSPKEALVKAQSVIEKAQTLAQDKAEGRDFVTAFGGIMSAAGANPENPYGGMIDFFKQNTALIGKKGAVEAIKLAQTAIASDRKDKADQRRDELGWARVEALAAKASSSGASAETKAANLAKRDISVRLRDAQRAYVQAVKGGDPAAINDAVDSISYLNDQAQEVGVPLAKVPAKRETAEETAALQQQAIDNLKAQRGAFGRFFNKSPSPKEVQAEMERLRQSAAAQPTADEVQPPPAKPSAARPGKNLMPGAAAHAPQQPQQQSKQQSRGDEILSGNNVVVSGQSYPLNHDGTVTIDGRKYRVQ